MTKPINIVKAYIDPYTGVVYADEGKTSNLTPIGFVISSGTSVGGALLHSSLAGLGQDDHTQYVLVNASRPFSGLPLTTASGTPPTLPGHLITKAYLDTVVVSGVAGVASLNSLTGAINLIGSGSASFSIVGNDIYLTVSGTTSAGTLDQALIGQGTVTVTSGINTITISGSDAAGSILKVLSLPLSPYEGQVVYLIPAKQFLGYTGNEWIILG